MRILMLNYEFPPLGGGAANANFNLLKQFAETNDLSIDLITSSSNTAKTESFSDRITIHRVDIGKDGQNFSHQTQKELLGYSVKSWSKARSLIKKYDYDLIHAWFGIPCGFIAMLLKWQYQIPYIISLRGADVPGYKDRFKLLDKLFFGWLNRFFVWKQANKVIANSKKLKQLALKTAPKQEIAVIANGVDTELFKSNWKKPDDKLRITPGWTRLEKRKRIDLLLKAVAKTGQNLEVVIPGTGKELSKLKELASQLDLEKQVQFLEIGENTAKNRERVAEVLAKCHILCLPSDNEGMSNAVLEGMASGLVLLLTDVGGTEELLEDGENGYLIKRNQNSIQTKLDQLLSNKDKIIQMGKQSREKATSSSWKSVAANYLNEYGV